MYGIMGTAATKQQCSNKTKDALTVVYVPISQIKLYEKNPRSITRDQFEKLKISLQCDEKFFQSRPCLLHKTAEGELLCYAGNQRLRAAKAIGWKEVPCIIEENLTDEMIKERCVKDNLHHGDWDWEALANDYDPIKLLEWGMLQKDLDIATDEGQDAPIPPDPECETCPECGQKIKPKKDE